MGDAPRPATELAKSYLTMAGRADAAAKTAFTRAVATRFPVLPPPVAIVEIVVLFGLIVSLGWLTGQDLADLRPHPFWVPVLLLSLQYGTVSGLLAAGIATVFTGLGQFPEQVVGESYFVYFLRIWIEPILWISAAVLLGQFRMRQIANKMELVRQVDELAAQRTSLADYAGKLRQRCATLERRLAGRTEPDALVMLQTLARARQAGALGLAPAFAAVMAAVLPGSRASLFVLEAEPRGAGTMLRRIMAVPPHQDDGTAAELNATHPLFQAVVGRAEGASVLTAVGEAVLARQGILAVPVRSDAGSVIGMLKVEAMDTQLLGPSSLGALDAVASALAAALPGASGAGANGHAVARPVGAALAIAAANPGTAQGVWRHVAKRLPVGLGR